MPVCIRWSEVGVLQLEFQPWVVLTVPWNAAVVGKHVITVEGLGSVEHPHPLQERLAKLHGSQ